MGSAAHPLTFREAIIIERVRTTSELCAAVEAAQSARVFVYQEPDTHGDALAIEAFIESFGAATEGWSSPHILNKAPLLDLLRIRLRALEAIGIFVHQAPIEREIILDDGSEVTLTVAVIGFAKDPTPTRTVSLPAQLQAYEDQRGESD